jgi:hypothetical protein
MQQFEAYFQMEHDSKKSGKKYKKWHFYGYSPLPNNWRDRPHKVKGEWLHIELFDGLDRFRIGDTPLEKIM